MTSPALAMTSSDFLPTPNDESLVLWHDVCHVEDVPPDAGAAALFGAVQVALIRLGSGTGEGSFFALDNFDPFSHAPVIARGIVGDKNGIPKIASPIYKQTFDLRTGQCFEDSQVRLRTFPVRVRDGRVYVGLPR